MGGIWEVSLGDFLLVTLFLGGGAAYLTGRAVAVDLAALPQPGRLHRSAHRRRTGFIHFALFGGTLLSLQFYVRRFRHPAGARQPGYRVTRAGQMTSQYSWLYRTVGPVFLARPRKAAPRPFGGHG